MKVPEFETRRSGEVETWQGDIKAFQLTIRE